MISIPSLRSLVVLCVASITPILAADPPAAANPADSAETVPLKKAMFFVMEDFENTDVGKIPMGFTSKGSVGVVDDVAHTGKHSLRLNAAVSGARQIIKQGAELAAMGGEHWGRLFFKVQLPSPLPAKGGMHTTIVVGSAKSPLAKDNIEVRLMGTLTGGDGSFRFLYNVQPPNGRKEFGPSSKKSFKYTDEWTLAEWHVNYATQTYQYFINGEELPDISFTKGEGNFAGAEIPAVFETMSFGWQNYQAAAGTGFVAWIDDLALTKQRIGGQTTLPVGAPDKKK
jgi:hypothetical protein